MEVRMIVGYARVSTDGQTLDAQQAALKTAGAEKVFAEKVSGAQTDRKALAKAIDALGAGDVLLVTRLDRLARSTRDLLIVHNHIRHKVDTSNGENGFRWRTQLKTNDVVACKCGWAGLPHFRTKARLARL